MVGYDSLSGTLVANEGTYVNNQPRRPVFDRDEEAALVTGILAGKVDDFEIIIRRYSERLANLVRRHLHREDELEDALQDIFLRIYTSLPRFKGKSKLYTWIYSIANNYLIDRLRKKRIRKISEEDLDESGRELEVETDGGGNPEFAVERDEEEKLIWLAMECMEPLFKNILILREVEDMSYEDMAQVMRVGIGTVKSRLFRARAELKKRYLALCRVGNGKG
jgi:RNA polymerase sigma-70 factor (ECF subfamily)